MPDIDNKEPYYYPHSNDYTFSYNFENNYISSIKFPNLYFSFGNGKSISLGEEIKWEGFENASEATFEFLNKLSEIYPYWIRPKWVKE